MIVIEHQSTDPAYNLAFEEQLYTAPRITDDYFVLWRNQSSVIVGKHQNIAQEVDLEYVQREGVEVFRRISGGGAVYHDLGNLNYSFIIKEYDEKQHNQERLTRPLLAALKRLGIPAHLSPRHDLLVHHRKVSGTARRISRGRLLHHGTLLIAADLSRLSKALRPSSNVTESKAVQSVRSPVTNLCEHTGQSLTIRALEEAIVHEIRTLYTVRCVRDISGKEHLAARELVIEKYQDWNWTYGNNPAFTIEHELDSGRRVAVWVKNGLIEECVFVDGPVNVQLSGKAAALSGKRYFPHGAKLVAEALI